MKDPSMAFGPSVTRWTPVGLQWPLSHKIRASLSVCPLLLATLTRPSNNPTHTPQDYRSTNLQQAKENHSGYCSHRWHLSTGISTNIAGTRWSCRRKQTSEEHDFSMYRTKNRLWLWQMEYPCRWPCDTSCFSPSSLSSFSCRCCWCYRKEILRFSYPALVVVVVLRFFLCVSKFQTSKEKHVRNDVENRGNSKKG